MDEFEGAIDGLASVGLAVYLALVLINGNVKPFLKEVSTETGFLEFIIAIFILYQISKVAILRPVTYPLIAMAVIIMVMRIVSNTNTSKFRDYASGRISLFHLATSLFN